MAERPKEISEFHRLSELLNEYQTLEKRKVQIAEEARQIRERFNADLASLGLPPLFKGPTATTRKTPNRPAETRLGISAGKAFKSALKARVPEDEALDRVLKAIAKTAKKHRLEISQKVIEKYTQKVKQWFRAAA